MEYLRAGQILRVDLTERKVNREPISPYVDRFIGGKGINLKILFDGVERGVNPFDAENLLLFGVGPLVGTPFPGACRTDVMAKSPVTGAFGNSSMGGYLGAELKFAGYDNLIIEGRAEKPAYLYIRDDQIEIRDASAIWGHDTYETPFMVREDLNDPKAKVVCIGPAGERLVVYSSIMSGTGNAAALTGMGAVMGSKNLKAIAVRGTKGIAVARPREFLERCKSLLDLFRQNTMYVSLHEVGLTRIHDREMRNVYELLLGGAWKGSEAICEAEFLDKYLYRRVGCFACPVACFDSYNIAGVGSGAVRCSPYGDFTWDVRNPDMMVFWQIFTDCQRYGLDCRSLSNTLAWLMKLHEKGIITSRDTDGIAMEWGSPKAILPMARKISYREGIGDLLADGLLAAAKKIGHGAEEYLLVAKGSPSDLHMAPLKTRVLAAAVGSIGEDAQVQSFLDAVSARRYVLTRDEASFEEAIQRYKERAEKEVGMRQAADPRIIDGKAILVRHDEERNGIADMTGVCTWMTSSVGQPVDSRIIADFMTLGLGTTVEVNTLIEAATRMHHLERAFVGKCGFTRRDDRVSKAYYGRLQHGDKPLPELGANEAELEKMKDDYYRLLGWDVETGIPTRETLEKYGLVVEADSIGL